MSKPLVANHTSPDGNAAVKVEMPVFFTREEAARALALIYPDQEPLRGEREVRMGLSRAARDRVLAKPGLHPNAELVQAYEPIVDRHWPGFAKYTDEHVRVGAGHEQATASRFIVDVLVTVEDAAVALAWVHNGLPSRVGQVTVERGLRRAARDRVLARPELADRVDADAAQRWRAWLQVVGPWARSE